MIALLCFFLTLFASEFSVHTAASPPVEESWRFSTQMRRKSLSFTGRDVLRRHSLDHMSDSATLFASACAQHQPSEVAGSADFTTNIAETNFRYTQCGPPPAALLIRSRHWD